MSTLTYFPPDSILGACDEIGGIIVSSITQIRGTTVMGFEIAVKAGAGPYEVVDTFWEEQEAECRAAHALLVEQIGALM